jgi:hypothetical protein
MVGVKSKKVNIRARSRVVLVEVGVFKAAEAMMATSPTVYYDGSFLSSSNYWNIQSFRYRHVDNHPST